jgi:hypothetical protein
VAAGASGSTSEETMRLENLRPGHYRLDVHNWARPPATEVKLKISFFNAFGEPGPGG